MKRVYLIITMALTMLISVPAGYTQSPFNLPERDQDNMALEYTLQRFNHIEDVLNTCPQNDPYYGTIRSQFVIRRNGIWVGDIPCTEPVSEMPISQYSDELITLQALRVMFYMDRGQSGHLPWTPGTLYDWVKSKIQGINLSDTAEDNHCCDGFWDGTYIVIQTEDDEKRDFKRNWMGISAAIALYAHETRHVDGFGHLFCCPFCADGTCGVKAACDQTFDPSNLSPYGIQWWLNKSWLMGDINVGFSCLSPEEVQEIANWHLASTTMVYGDRFCDNVPPEVPLPQNPGGICERAFAPGTPGGPVSGAAGSGYGYTAAGASCSTGDFVHYLFDWGDGSYSGWCVSNVNNMAHAYKTWVSPGTYTVKAQARCSYNPIIRSDWSPGLTVTITTPSFIITSPEGGENWQAGTKQIISWTYTGNIGIRVKIELLDEKGTIKTITNTSVGRAGAGSYSWLIPKSRKPGDYRIRISSRSYTAISAGSLTIIAPPSITLTVPNGGETMQAGWTSYRNPNIQWKYTGDPGPNVKIELLKRGSLDSTIAASISTGSGGTGSYYWDIPPAQAPGANYKIRITSTSNGSCTDTSNKNFTIIASPTITITSPNGGKSWQAGSTQTIKWTYGGNPYSAVGNLIKIELLKGETSDSTLPTNVSAGSRGSGSYHWAIPLSQAPGSAYRIRVTYINYSKIMDTY